MVCLVARLCGIFTPQSVTSATDEYTILAWHSSIWKHFTVVDHNDVIVKHVCPLRFAQLLVQVESLMGERMELHREVFLLRQKLRDTAAKVAERSWLECRVAFLEHQLHAADAAAASSSHQMPDGPSTPHTQVQVLWSFLILHAQGLCRDVCAECCVTTCLVLYMPCVTAQSCVA